MKLNKKLKKTHIATLLALALTGTLAGGLSLQAQDENTDVQARIDAVKERLARIENRAEGVEDYNQLEKLQRQYGFYTDKMLWDDVAALFTEDATLEIGLSGVYEGRERIREYLYSLSEGEVGPIEGEMYNHFQIQPVITIAEDGQSAKGRWRSLLQLGSYSDGEGSGGQWGAGPYENEYVKEDGVWKISKLHWGATFIAPYEGGWANASRELVEDYSVSDTLEPDAPGSDEYDGTTGARLPFHFDGGR